MQSYPNQFALWNLHFDSGRPIKLKLKFQLRRDNRTSTLHHRRLTTLTDVMSYRLLNTPSRQSSVAINVRNAVEKTIRSARTVRFDNCLTGLKYWSFSKGSYKYGESRLNRVNNRPKLSDLYGALNLPRTKE